MHFVLSQISQGIHNYTARKPKLRRNSLGNAALYVLFLNEAPSYIINCEPFDEHFDEVADKHHVVLEKAGEDQLDRSCEK
jgi:hypothetical protein